MTDGVDKTDPRGVYCGLSDGTKLYLNDVAPDAFAWRTWVWHLQGINRFGGGSRLSVWDHTLNCVAYAQHVGMSEATQRQLLFHDWEEVILADRVRPVKALLGQSQREQDLARKIRSVAHAKFLNRSWDGNMDVDATLVDNTMLRMEFKEYMPRVEAPAGLPTPDPMYRYKTQQWPLSLRALELGMIERLGVNIYG